MRVAVSLILGLMLAGAVSAEQTKIVANAAEAYFDPAQMAAARAALRTSHGDQVNTMLFAERLEYQSNEGDALSVWEGQGWWGNDAHKLWLKTEGEFEHDGSELEEAELQVLYSRAIRPFWDLQVGLRHDVRPNPSRSFAVVGLHGMAPYWLEVDGAVFLSDEGDASMRIEAEYELLLTQRLILQPRVELNAALSDDRDAGVGSGLSTLKTGLRLRYEIRRQFAPYLGVSWKRAFGDTADFVRAEGKDRSSTSIVVGIRFWL